MNTEQHIYLTGFMGSGKSTIGKQLANDLNRQFIDTDQLIEQQSSRSIPEIFEQFGEQYFRRLETELIKTVSAKKPAIISLGGGAFIQSQNRDIIRNSGLTIYLQWTVETLFDRLKNCSDRPLLVHIEPDNRFFHINDMLLQRERFYNQADVIINCDRFKNITEIVSLIKMKIKTL